MTNDDEGEGGVNIPPKIDDVIYEQPLRASSLILAWIQKLHFAKSTVVTRQLRVNYCFYNVVRPRINRIRN